MMKEAKVTVAEFHRARVKAGFAESTDVPFTLPVDRANRAAIELLVWLVEEVRQLKESIDRPLAEVGQMKAEMADRLERVRTSGTLGIKIDKLQGTVEVLADEVEALKESAKAREGEA